MLTFRSFGYNFIFYFHPCGQNNSISFAQEWQLENAFLFVEKMLNIENYFVKWFLLQPYFTISTFWNLLFFIPTEDFVSLSIHLPNVIHLEQLLNVTSPKCITQNIQNIILHPISLKVNIILIIRIKTKYHLMNICSCLSINYMLCVCFPIYRK